MKRPTCSNPSTYNFIQNYNYLFSSNIFYDVIILAFSSQIVELAYNYTYSDCLN